jgi:hypothetical protein
VNQNSNGCFCDAKSHGRETAVGREEPDAFPVNGHSTRKATRLADFRGPRKVIGAARLATFAPRNLWATMWP